MDNIMQYCRKKRKRVCSPNVKDSHQLTKASSDFWRLNISEESTGIEQIPNLQILSPEPERKDNSVITNQCHTSKNQAFHEIQNIKDTLNDDLGSFEINGFPESIFYCTCCNQYHWKQSLSKCQECDGSLCPLCGILCDICDTNMCHNCSYDRWCVHCNEAKCNCFVMRKCEGEIKCDCCSTNCTINYDDSDTKQNQNSLGESEYYASINCNINDCTFENRCANTNRKSIKRKLFA